MAIISNTKYQNKLPMPGAYSRISDFQIITPASALTPVIKVTIQDYVSAAEAEKVVETVRRRTVATPEEIAANPDYQAIADAQWEARREQHPDQPDTWEEEDPTEWLPSVPVDITGWFGKRAAEPIQTRNETLSLAEGFQALQHAAAALSDSNIDTSNKLDALIIGIYKVLMARTDLFPDAEAA